MQVSIVTKTLDKDVYDRNKSRNVNVIIGNAQVYISKCHEYSINLGSTHHQGTTLMTVNKT